MAGTDKTPRCKRCKGEFTGVGVVVNGRKIPPYFCRCDAAPPDRK